MRISSGSRFEDELGYSRAVVAGGFVFISGTTGYDYETMVLAKGVAAQAEQCCKNVAQALADAGSSLDRVVRVRYILPRREDFAACLPALRRAFGVARPAATFVQAQLLEPDMLIEIEVTALLNAAGAAIPPGPATE